MFMSSSRNKFTLLYQNLVADVLLVFVHHVGAHPGGHQHGVSIQISTNLGKTFLQISRIRNILLTWILGRVFVYLPPFISQILNFINWMVLILILIYFEWRNTENQRYWYNQQWIRSWMEKNILCTWGQTKLLLVATCTVIANRHSPLYSVHKPQYCSCKT